MRATHTATVKFPLCILDAFRFLNVDSINFLKGAIIRPMIEYHGLNINMSYDTQEENYYSLGKPRSYFFQKEWLTNIKEIDLFDWSKVSVDAKIQVTDDETESYANRHFAKFEDGKIHAWKDGQTSHTAKSQTTVWKYARLAE